MGKSRKCAANNEFGVYQKVYVRERGTGYIIGRDSVDIYTVQLNPRRHPKIVHAEEMIPISKGVPFIDTAGQEGLSV